MSQSSFHIVACPYPAEGHFRPLLAFATTAVEKHQGLIFTVFAFRTFVDFAQREIKRSGVSEEATKRIRVIGLSDAIPAPGLASMETTFVEISKNVPEAYVKIVSGGSVTCTATGAVIDYAGIPPPTVTFTDWLSPYVGQAFKGITPTVKLLIHWATTSGYCMRLSGPKELGGLGSWEAETKAAMELGENKGKTLNEVATALEDSQYRLRGVPVINADGVERYDYELSPQEMPRGQMAQLFIDSIRQLATYADGIVLATTETFEPKTAEAIRKWVEGDLGKKIWFTGPQSASKLLSAKGPEFADSSIPDRFPRVFKFLDAQPAKSVWLIAFGTIFFPWQRPNHLVILINTLINTKTPFILSQAGLAAMYAPLSQETKDVIDKSGLGLVLDVVPQQEVLQHPSVSAFVTHGGANSTFEAITTGVVPIFWPFTSDQPFHAGYLSQTRDAGFELIQIRSGDGAKNPLKGPTYEGTDEAVAAEFEQIIKDLKGEVGDKKRQNLQNVRAEIVTAVTSGQIDAAIEDLIAYAQGN